MSVIISLIFAGDTMVTQKLARQYFEKSWNARVKKKDFEGFDDGIVPMLLDMNKLDGVTTVFSCGGHPEGQSFYIAFALSKGATKKIVSIHKKILKKTSKLKIFLGNIELEYSRLFPDEKLSKILTKCPKKIDQTFWFTTCMRFYFKENATENDIKYFQNILHGEVLKMLRKDGMKRQAD